MAEACQAGVKALGLELFSTRPAEGLTAFRVPSGLKDGDIRNRLADRFGITAVGGQDKLKGKIIRVGHMGYTDELDVVSGLAALEIVLERAWVRHRARCGGDRRAAGVARSQAGRGAVRAEPGKPKTRLRRKKEKPEAKTSGKRSRAGSAAVFGVFGFSVLSF